MGLVRESFQVGCLLIRLLQVAFEVVGFLFGSLGFLGSLGLEASCVLGL